MIQIDFYRNGVIEGSIECGAEALINPRSWVNDCALPFYDGCVWRVHQTSEDRKQRRAILRRAYCRGYQGHAADVREDVTPGYIEAWALGASYRARLAESRRVVEPHCLVGCGCPSCRFDRIVDFK